jgi:EAL domain-containing protein (putative c-di-GMP-specific phosphodiesterase class I)/GGDEF domain-containing protein
MDSTHPVDWEKTVWLLHHAFQPIARFADGGVYGFEALLRGWDEAGFSSIADVFDRAFESGCLLALDFALRKKAFQKFAKAGLGNAKLFYNLDTRLLLMPGFASGKSRQIAEETSLSTSRVVFEITELFDPEQSTEFDRVVAAYREQGFRIALDDFGSGYAGLKLLHRASPDIVKIDRYFVAGSAEEPRKAAFLEKIAGMAHLMGISVVAEGVETAAERQICLDAGCDLVQGFLVARPECDASNLQLRYESAMEPRLLRPDERRRRANRSTLENIHVTMIDAVELGADLSVLLTRFRKNPDISLIPVVDAGGQPIGIFRERDFREYVYSPFGISVLEHLAAQDGPERFLVEAPVLPLGSEMVRVVSAFGTMPDAGCILLTEEGRYAGILPADRLLGIIADLELTEARDQNPLSRLPGNLRISEICAERLDHPAQGMIFAYYDFDNFKPYNDHYGFRSGDRVIMLFADILRATFMRPSDFIGHLGGDDFFASMESASLERALPTLVSALERFTHEVQSFYTQEDRERGWLLGKNREGRQRKMGLLTASLAVVHLEPCAEIDAEGLSELLAVLKKEAKSCPSHVAARSVTACTSSRAMDGPGESGTPGQADSCVDKPGRQARRRAEPVFTPSLLAY